MLETAAPPLGRSAEGHVDLSPHFARVTDDPLRDAFDDARRPHPPTGAAAVPEEEVPAAWEARLDAPRQGPGTAYVHIPFCAQRCLYCGFYQNPWRAERGPWYVDRLIAELDRLDGRPALEGPPLRALYLGGGTPTALAPRDLARLLDAARARLPLAPDCEITLEGRVGDLDPDRLRAAVDAGVNRVSLGVQTFDTEVRRALGRRDAREQVVATLERLVAADFGAVVIDLIYGLPGQTVETWKEDLRLVCALGIDGVDLYSLALIPGTPLLRAMEKGRARPADRATLGALYREGYEALEREGWEPISTTHWRSPSLRERSVYNFEVKTGADYFGIGAGAGGSLGGWGFRVESKLERYAERVQGGACPVASMTRPSARAPIVHRLRAGMERGRLDPARVASVPDGAAAMARLEPLLEQWREAGLLVRRHRFHDLTVAGRFWQVQMTQRLIQAVNA